MKDRLIRDDEFDGWKEIPVKLIKSGGTSVDDGNVASSSDSATPVPDSLPGVLIYSMTVFSLTLFGLGFNILRILDADQFDHGLPDVAAQCNI